MAIISQMEKCKKLKTLSHKKIAAQFEVNGCSLKSQAEELQVAYA